MTPEVSIIVPCRNERESIESCLQSMLAQELLDGDFEVIVADGMSDDGTREILGKLVRNEPRLMVIDNPAWNIAAGLNAAIRIARGNIIIRMDAHTKYASDYIQQCLSVLKETGADNVGGPWVAEGNGYVGRAIAAAFPSPFGVGGARGRNPTYEGPVDTVYLGCWAREVFDRIGFFDEKLVRSDDDELNLRLTRAGGKIWQSPRIKSWYAPRESIGDLFKHCVADGYWKVCVIQKHKIPASIRHLIPGCFVLSLIVLALASPWSRVGLWGWLGLAGLYLLCNLVASALTAVRVDWRLFPMLPLVFACYHFGYGYGFLRGLLDFIVLKRKPAHAYTQLTRPSTREAQRSGMQVNKSKTGVLE
jgi:succinoglycan biosynthesis protein ExoA